MLRFGMLVAVALGLFAITHDGWTGGKDKPKTKFKDLKFDGTLSRDDPKDPKRNSPCKIHEIELTKGQSYTIDMAGIGFDAYLRLDDKDGKQLAEDDDSGGNLNAQIVFNCQKDGAYKVYCTSLGNGVGKYILTVKASGAVTFAAAQAVLFDKRAPDFQADFAVNGKAVKLSELKGKVVLLDFWSIHSPTNAAALTRLREWHEKHKDAGLEVVGVTYYASDIGQKLRFDPKSGRLDKADDATPDTDRAMLKNFAAYHKVGYLQLALAKEQALKAFNDYLVDGLPQIVLIDREGMVRAAYAGDVQVRHPDVDVELKKLLGEKK